MLFITGDEEQVVSASVTLSNEVGCSFAHSIIWQ